MIAILPPGVALRRSLSGPGDVDAIVQAEDTYGVLSGDPTLRDPGESPLRTFTAALEVEPHPLGTVLVRGGSPPRLLAVIHDLDVEPSWTENTVRAAWAAVLAVVAARGWTRIAVEPLGARHGRASLERVEELLADALASSPPSTLREIRVLLPRAR